MRVEGAALRLSATDLANALACRHLTQLDRAVAEGRRKKPDWRDPALALLQQRGLVHERAYVEHLKASGVTVVSPGGEGEAAAAATVAAMRGGAGAILQAELRAGRWGGRADVLLLVPQPSNLGLWSYEVVDTKLAQETRGGTVLQLCLYSDLLEKIQGRPPELMHVVKPAEGFLPESFKYNDFQAYYHLVRLNLEEAVGTVPPTPTYPAPVAHCEICRWRAVCEERWHADDNLCLVAGIRAMHVGELERQGIHRLAEYAREPAPLRERPARGSVEAFARAHGQARIQLAGRDAARPLYELLPPEPGFGLATLPEPAAGDLFFDIESDPFAGDGGMEYLLGAAFREGGAFRYTAFWALDRGQERRALEAFIDLAMDRWREDPGMHIYHFSPYEPAAVKRLIGRHATREADVDRLLRAGRFVDLLSVTRRGLRASVESYSLKALEEHFGFRRGVELPDAGAALRRIAWALELGGPQEVTPEDRSVVEGYNRDDCLSAAALRDWLEARRAELEAAGQAVPRPEERSGEASQAVEEREADVQEVFDALARDLPEGRSTWGPAERARWLLAYLLDYFRREDKCAWWEFFRIHELDHEELLGERKAISGLEFIGAAGGTAARPVHRYRFPPQEAAIDPGDELHEVGGERIGEVHAMDPLECILEIDKRAGQADSHPRAVMVNERVNPHPMDGALLELARSASARGVDGAGPYRAARDLLLKGTPRLAVSSPGPLRRPGENLVKAAIRLASGLDHGILPIQGPPGTGKTYTGARMIVALARAGRSVGVTAVSHKVIRNLLAEAIGAASEAGVPFQAAHKVGRRAEETSDGIENLTENAQASPALEAGKVLGGSAWLWAREDMVGSVDYLFVDEAGQMSLAQALAAGRSAMNLVLLGDPQQLEQPQRGSHPEGAEVAALVHLLEGRKTIAEDAGLFLEETWRLAPRICRFTSELFYEGRLRSRPGLERQALGGGTPFAGSGLFYAPVEHSGNQASSPEEADAVARIAEGLLAPGVTWTDAAGQARRVQRKDILVVAPYNAQVAALTARLAPGVRVGTVDRFQGQQAPVVIYSMASSSAEDAPRGMGFLYNPNRLNVATSRAQCACILVAARRVLEPECASPEQMRWANALCRFRELAAEVSI